MRLEGYKKVFFVLYRKQKGHGEAPRLRVGVQRAKPFGQA